MVNIPLNDVAARQHFLQVKAKLQDRALKLLNAGAIKWDGKKCILDDEANMFLQSISFEDVLMQILGAPPEELSELIADLQLAYPGLLSKHSAVYKVAYNVFIDHGYDSAVFDKLAFIESVAKDTCLYCNRNYIFTLDQQNKVKPEIDHFYPKTIYPVLGLSYYNLIPSCETCNGINCKNDDDPCKSGLVNPYLIKESDFEFTYDVGSVSVVNPLASHGSIKIRFKRQIAANVRVFKLDKLYEKHTDHVLELIIKSRLKYTDRYRKYLNSYKGLVFSKKEIDRLIIGNYTSSKDIHKRPLAKLYQDIAKELGLI